MLLGTKNSKQTQEIEQQVPKRGVPFGKNVQINPDEKYECSPNCHVMIYFT